MEPTYWILAVALQCAIFGGLSSYVADEKGYSWGAWFAIGFLFSIGGLIAAAGLPRIAEVTQIENCYESLLKRCPECAEYVRIEAAVCRYCGHAFHDRQSTIELLKRKLEKAHESEGQSVYAERVEEALEYLAPKGPME